MSTFSSDDVFEDPFSEEDGVYDDPYEVVMYDIDESAASDVHALLNMLTDEDRSWFAKRRLSVLAAAGPLSALVADIIVDSLGRKWDPLLHPRDRFGRFIETGGFFRWFMKGAWAKGQVVRIDSDGTIHARSKGNDGIPDGTPIKFNSKQANKLISTASDKASLSNALPDFDAPIPDFPEASAAQRRVYNMLQFGDMPGEDLYIHRDPDMDSTAFGNEMADLVKRNLISIDKGDKPRARRNDQDALGVLDFGDDEIDDVPEGETPDLDDSPELTKAQRDLYDQMVEMDRGEGDGIGRDELNDIDEADLDALVEAGVLERDGDRFDLVNPEGTDEAAEVDGTPAPELDAADAMDKAAQAAFPDDIDMQDAFNFYASELAFGDAGGDLPEDVRPAAARRAKAAAEAWWEEFNAPEAGGDVPEADAPETAEQAPQRKRREEYRSEAQEFLGLSDWPEGYLESDKGEKHIVAVTDLLYAADLDEAGETQRAELNRGQAKNKLRDIGIEEKEIEKLDLAVGAFREDQKLVEAEAPEAEEADVPEAEVDVPEDMPEADADVPEELPEEGTPEPEAGYSWDDFSERLAEAPEPNYADRVDQEIALADEMGLNLNEGEAPDSWKALTDDIGEERAAQLFVQNNGNIGQALADLDAENNNRGVDTPGADVPEEEIADDFGSTEIGPDTARNLEGIDFNLLGKWANWAGRVRDRRDEDSNLAAELEDERLLADEMGLDLNAPGGIDTWTNFTDDIGEEEAGAYYDEFKGDITLARLNHMARELGDGPDAELDQANAENELDRREAEADLPDDADVPSDPNNIGLLNQPPPTNPDLERVRNGEGVMRNGEFVSFNTLNAEEAEADADAPSAGPATPPAADGTPASQHPVHQQLVAARPFNIEDHDYVTDDGRGIKDAEGNLVELGLWYHAGAGGGGDVLEAVGYYDQDQFPGWVIGRRPDGKLKAIHVHGAGGPGGAGGMRGIPTNDLDEVRNNWQAQHRIKVENGFVEIDEQNDVKAGNKMSDEAGGIPAEVGMVVEGVSNRKNAAIPRGQIAFVHRIQVIRGEVVAYVGFPGAESQEDLKPIPVRLLKVADRPDTPEPPTPTPDLTPEPEFPSPDGLNEFPVRQWQIPLDESIMQFAHDMGEVPLVDYANAHIRPGEVNDQVQALVRAGRLEFVPDPPDGKPRFRVPARDGQADLLSDLPDGAENNFEGSILDAIDASEGGRLRRAEIVPDIEDDDAEEKLAALRQLVERGVLEQVESSVPGGRPSFRRPAINRGSGSSPRSNDPSRGTDAGGQSMSHADAVDALRGGADPMTVNTDNLYRAMQDSGRFEFRRFKDKNIGDTEWAFDNDVNGPVEVGGDRRRRYFVKRPDETEARSNWRAELMAAGISQHVGASGGDPGENNGALYHPQTTGISPERIMADHIAYAFPEGTVVTNLDPDDDDMPSNQDFSIDDLRKAAPDRVRLAMYDYLINNSLDRHGGNQMLARLPDGSVRVVIIDNGFGDGENFEYRDPTNADFRSFVDSGGWYRRTQQLLEHVGRFNNGLTRDDLRGIVESFYAQYSSIDPDAIINSLSTTHRMEREDTDRLRTWLEASKARVENIGSNVDEIVEVLASTMGV